MEKLDEQAIRELRAIMDSRGVALYTGRLISLAALPNTRAMVNWLKDNPTASVSEMREKAKELGEDS